MIPMIQDLVVSHGWLDTPTLIDFIAVAESTPGPFAINIATFVGSHQAGFFGAASATLGVVLPSFIIILIVAGLFSKFQDNKYVQAVLSGLRPVIISMIAAAILSVAITVFYTEGSIKFGSVLIFIILMLINLKKKIHPILMISISAVLGIIIYSIPM